MSSILIIIIIIIITIIIMTIIIIIIRRRRRTITTTTIITITIKYSRFKITPNQESHSDEAEQAQVEPAPEGRQATSSDHQRLPDLHPGKPVL